MNVENKVDFDSPDFEVFLSALSKVESNNVAIAQGDYVNGKPTAFGVLQLHDIYIRDVNERYNLFYDHVDAFVVGRARTIVRLYLQWYCHAYEQHTKKPCTYEIAARMHNGGPNGWQKEQTLPYWAKVKRILEAAV